MAPNIDDELTEALHERADRIEVSRDLAAGAKRQWRRQRTSRWAIGAAVVVVVAVLVPLGLALGPSGLNGIGPIGDGDGSGDPVKLSIDLDELDLGEPPQVPWYANGIIHHNGRETHVAEELVEAPRFWFVPITGGYVTTVNEESSTVIGTDGQVKWTIPVLWPLVSADGSTLISGKVHPDRLVTIDTATGQVRHTLRHKEGGAIGLLQDRVVVGFRGHPLLWNPESGQTSPLEAVSRVKDDYPVEVTTNGRNLVIVEERLPEGTNPLKTRLPCVTVLDADQDFQRLWKSCNIQILRLARNASYAQGYPSFRMPPAKYSSIIDPRTGQTLMTVADSAPITGSPVSEPDGDLLFTTNSDLDRQAIVRCNLDGNCELATKLRPESGEIFALPGQTISNYQ